MCSACMTISPAGSNSAVEESRRSLMFAECAARISTAPISSHAARRAPDDDAAGSTGSQRVTRALQPDRPRGSTRPAQPGGTASVASGSSQIAGPRSSVPGSGSPVSTAASCSAPSNHARRRDRVGAAPGGAGGAASISGPGSVAVTRTVTSSTSPSVVAVAVARSCAASNASRSASGLGRLAASTASSNAWPR